MTKQIFTRVLFLTTIFTLLISCNHSSDEIPVIVNNPNGDYFPTAARNSWTFKKNGEADSEIKIFGFKDINGFSYSQFGVNTGQMLFGASGDDNYLRKSSDNYYVRAIGQEEQPYEYIVLKDNVDVNSLWEGTFSYDWHPYPFEPEYIETIKYKYKGKILAKNAQEVINGQTVKNIIKVRLDFERYLFDVNMWNYQGNYELWFAKNIGIVKFAFKVFRNEIPTSNDYFELKDVKLY